MRTMVMLIVEPYWFWQGNVPVPNRSEIQRTYLCYNYFINNMFSHLRWFVDCARFGLNTIMTLWWVFWRLRWNSRPLGGSLVSAGYLLAHWYLQQYKCTTGYLQLNGALSIKLHMCHHHHFGRLHKQTNGLWVRFCHHSANPVLESYGEGLEVEEHVFYCIYWGVYL